MPTTRTSTNANRSPFESTYPAVPTDPVAAWEAKRLLWLSPRSSAPTASTSSSPPVPPRRSPNPLFAERLRLLEEMLSLSPDDGFEDDEEEEAAAAAAVRDEDALEEDEPDGGEVVRDKGAKAGREELERAIEAILAAFRVGRALKEPVPLSLVTKLLYRQWRLDGTIPPDYESLSTPTPSLAPPPAPPTPLFAAALYASSHGPQSDDPTTTTPPRPPLDAGSGGLTPPLPPPPPPPPPQTRRPLLKMDALKGSGWRVDKDVASGSDAI